MFQDPKHRYVVAEDATGTIVGFIARTILTKGGVGEVEDEYPEWEPNTPEGTNLELISAYVIARRNGRGSITRRICMVSWNHGSVLDA
jgi:hypothetical protein